jgi:FlaG/FlaF family flagellin (archaellin)
MTVTAVRLAIALVVTLAMVLMTLRIGSSPALSRRVERNETESFVSHNWQFHGPIYRHRLLKRPFASSKIEYYLDLGTGATCVVAGEWEA